MHKIGCHRYERCCVWPRIYQVVKNLLLFVFNINTLVVLVGESNFHVSIIDNSHSRAAGLVGLHGVLGTNPQEIVIADPCTGESILSWQWHQFHQFHFQAPAHPVDDKQIIIMHTSGLVQIFIQVPKY